MNTPQPQPPTRLAPLVGAWVFLVLLTLASLGFANSLRGADWLPELVASMVWLKAWLVARYFLETPHCHIFIRLVVWNFIAFAPLALVLTDLFGQQFAHWVQL